MKAAKLLSIVCISLIVLLVSCKGNKPKDMIVRKWALKEMSGGTTDQIPDSIKAKMINTTMEFKADNTYILSGMAPTPVKGTYSISDDGKSLTVIPDDTKKAETDVINELSDHTLKITDRLGNVLTCTN